MSPATSNAHVLIASSNAAFRKGWLTRFAKSDQPVLEALGGADVLQQLETASCRRLILDRQLPDLAVEDVVGMVREQYPNLSIEVMDSAVPAAMTQAPAAPADIAPAIAAPSDIAPPLPPRKAPQPALAPAQELLPGLVGRSGKLRQLAELAHLVAPRRTTVLITGETGTGKEVVARALHSLSPRHSRPWVVVNCAAIPESLLEAELFGYAKGAFTGAGQSRAGMIQAAHGSTLFLDEIGDLPLNLQAKLLRFLQEGELQRLGSNERQQVDVRVVAATNAALDQKVKEGAFRSDLYYRLAVFPLEIAPLRERREDVEPIAHRCLERWAGEAERGPARLSAGAAWLLEAYPWPGNVRELQHCLERSRILAGGSGELREEHFPAFLDLAGALLANGTGRA